MYLIPETDYNVRRQNQMTMAVANAIKSKRIIQMTSGEAGIENREKVFLLDLMETYQENQAKRGKKDGDQIDYSYSERFCRRTVNNGSNRQDVLPRIYRLTADGVSSKGQAGVKFYASYLLRHLERSMECYRAS